MTDDTKSHPEASMSALSAALSALSTSTTQTLHPMNDITSPYYLSNADCSTTSLITVVLTGTNYSIWRRTMTNALKGRNKLAFVDGSLEKPTTGSKEDFAREKCNSMVITWLNNSIAQELHSSVAFYETAYDIWRDLHERFAGSNHTRLFELKDMIYQTKQENMTVSEYYTKMKALWDEVNVVSKVLNCSCGGLKELQAEKEQERLHQFLFGINMDKFKTVRSQILGMDPVPSMNRAYAMLITEEKQLSIGSNRVPIEVSAFTVKPSSQSSQQAKAAEGAESDKPICGHCGIPGHPKEKCYQLIGYPTDWGTRGNRGRGRGRGRGGRRQQGATNTAATGGASNFTQQSVGSAENKVPGLSQEQVEQLLSLLGPEKKLSASANFVGNVSVLNNSSYWIFDSGASDHLVSTNACLMNLQSLSSKDLTTKTLIGVGEERDVQNQHHTTIKGLRSDNAQEIVQGPMKAFLEEKGIFHETSCIDTPQQNGVLERKHRHLLEVARALRFEANLPIRFWGECVLTAAYLINITPTPKLNGKTPYEALLKKSPKYDHLRVFGCLCYVHDINRSGDKFSPRAHRCIFIGYPLGKKAYQVYDLESHKIMVSRDVIFYENIFPFSMSAKESHPLPSHVSKNPVFLEDDHPFVTVDQNVGDKTQTNPPSSTQVSSSEPLNMPISSGMSSGEGGLPSARPVRVRRAPPYLQDYEIKFKVDGIIERYKARLVAKGYTQVEGIDYNETFVPVAKLTTVRCLLAIASAKNWVLSQMDVNNAFLHGDLHEEVYMIPPPGFTNPSDDRVCRLRKSLYGLKQASRQWFAKLTSALLQYGFHQSRADHSLFTLTVESSILVVLVYVDDLIIASNDPSLSDRFKHYLQTCFHDKDLGTLKYFLGLQVARSPTGIYLTQRKYALDILSDSGMIGSRPVSFPMAQQQQLALDNSPLLDDPSAYRRLVGRLIYLTITRPEITYSVNLLSQFMQEPRKTHMDAALRILRYIKSFPGQGLFFPADNDFLLSAFCDADWGGCSASRRSTSGFFIMLGKAPIVWKTKKQNTVARSSAEAEYRSMALTCTELLWLRALLKDLSVQHCSPMSLFCDNQAALYIANNPVFRERTKHVEVDCYFVRDHVLAGDIHTHYVASKDQVADLFTKALGNDAFHSLLRKLGIIDLHAPT
ncbi:Integrase, catalytic core [Corchorus capsularis]|uniref:Integrase, catalytic core n=1 Tax=Corchorus capsularis TaxID=210143 RepID=A0A1R3J5I2_COCAP|nr:Integrase, catalytic core [Corchorus capsularis]